MPKCIVIADDLTGANATGVLLKKMNYSAYTVLNAERLELSMLAHILRNMIILSLLPFCF